jgi:subtilisin family serine protease
VRIQPVHRVVLSSVVLVVAILASSASGVALVNQVPSSKGGTPSQDRSEAIPGRYIVTFEGSVGNPRKRARAQARQLDGKLGFVFPVINGYSVKGLSKAEVAELRDDPRVKHVRPDHWGGVAQTTPTGIERVFATANEGVERAEADNHRVDVDLAGVDTGVDHEHPDLNVVRRTNCALDEFEECEDGIGEDGRGHGTHVAGTIGALDNGDGVVGVAPGARLWAVKVSRPTGFGAASWTIAGIEWVTAHADQIEVANVSLGYPPTPEINEAIAASVEAGVVYVVAAGNQAGDAEERTPANSPDALSVSAVADYDGKPGGEADPLALFLCEETGEENYGEDDTLADFSNWGEAVDIAAPGVCIASTFPVTNSHWYTWLETSPGYGVNFGTSMASPHVAGAAAILASRENPDDRDDVEAIGDTIIEEGNTAGIAEGGWEDNSEDGIKEPLLDISDEAVFSPRDQGAVTGEAEILSTSQATLHGEVNPGGVETEFYFEYGTTPEYGSQAPASGGSAGSGDKYEPVEASLEGLEGQTPYHYRLVASNENGEFHGIDRVFGTTPPAATTEPATLVYTKNAELNAEVNPEGLETRYWFEYVDQAEFEENGYENAEIATSWQKPIGSGTSDVAVSETIGGLAGNTTYHFRIVATNSAGADYGDDETLTTEPAQLALEPETAFPASFSLSGTQKVRLRGQVPITCASTPGVSAVDGDGQYADAISGTVTLTLHNCTEPELESSCTSPGAESGTIQAVNLRFQLTYLADGRMGILFLPNAETGEFASAICAFGLSTIVISGSGVLGEIVEPMIGQVSSWMVIDLDAPAIGEGEYAQEYTETEAGLEYGLLEALNGGTPGPAALEVRATKSFSSGKAALTDAHLALEPPAGFPAPFSVVGEENATLRGPTQISCSTSGGVPALGGDGQFEDAASGTVTLRLRGCKASGTKCTSAGEEPGTIEAENLRFRLTYLAGGKMGIVFFPNAESGQFATVKCAFGLITIVVSGNGVLGEIADPGLGEVSSTLSVDLDVAEVGEGKYAQKHTETALGFEYGLMQSLNGGTPEPTTLEADAVETLSEGEGELVQE